MAVLFHYDYHQMILLIKRLKQEIKKLVLFLDIKKTKLMATVKNRKVKITFDSEEIKCVQGFMNAVQKQNLDSHWVTQHL